MLDEELPNLPNPHFPSCRVKALIAAVTLYGASVSDEAIPVKCSLSSVPGTTACQLPINTSQYCTYCPERDKSWGRLRARIHISGFWVWTFLNYSTSPSANNPLADGRIDTDHPWPYSPRCHTCRERSARGCGQRTGLLPWYTGWPSASTSRSALWWRPSGSPPRWHNARWEWRHSGQGPRTLLGIVRTQWKRGRRTLARYQWFCKLNTSQQDATSAFWSKGKWRFFKLCDSDTQDSTSKF